jgi:hypothetical protein
MGNGTYVLATAGQAFGFAILLLLTVFAAGVAWVLASRFLWRACARARTACRRYLTEIAIHATAARGVAEIERFLEAASTSRDDSAP